MCVLKIAEEKRRSREGKGTRRRNQVETEEKQAAPGKRRRGPKPVSKKTEQEENAPTDATNQDVTRDTNILWLSDSKFNLDRIKEAQKKDPIISRFIALKDTGDKPDWNDIIAQNNELKSYWVQWESMTVNLEGLLCS